MVHLVLKILADINNHEQDFKYCGMGAYHQKRVAERSIQTASNMARVMMLHASIRWPEMSDPSLWPMAVDYAAHIYNHQKQHGTEEKYALLLG